MKYGKFTFVLSLIVLFFTHNPIQGQSNSKEELGKALAASISEKDLTGFKSLVLADELTSRHEENYWEMMHLNEARSID